MKKRVKRKSRVLSVGLWLILLIVLIGVVYSFVNALIPNERRPSVQPAVVFCSVDSDCLDYNACTSDKCVNETCVYTSLINGALCDDGNLCTTKDSCFEGHCVGGTKVKCNDNDPCTDDLCVENKGCVYTPNSNSCDDDNLCTVNDVCSDGVCAGTEKNCDDGNSATIDSCTKSSGQCKHKDCVDYYYDSDGDNYGTYDSKCLTSSEGNYRATKLGDCNDNNAKVHPGAGELCNGVDDNCNGVIDPEGSNGCEYYYIDEDNDRHGALGTAPRCLCSPLGLYSSKNSDDCNDKNANINPGVAEICNDIDDNCNGNIDEDAAIGCNYYFKDGDVDGFGLTNDFFCMCAPRGLHTATKGRDCNDNDAHINPYGIEYCDHIDNNCNGIVDDNCIPLNIPVG